MKILAEQYSAIPSKWSGNIIVDNSLLNKKSYGRKEWSCDITLVDFADDGIILPYYMRYYILVLLVIIPKKFLK